jgi:hypothetical protein
MSVNNNVNNSVNNIYVMNWIFKKLDGGMDWIDLAQDTDR